MTQPENNDGNSAVQLTHVTRTYKRDELEVCARWMMCRTKMGLGLLDLDDYCSFGGRA